MVSGACQSDSASTDTCSLEEGDSEMELMTGGRAVVGACAGVSGVNLTLWMETSTTCNCPEPGEVSGTSVTIDSFAKLDGVELEVADDGFKTLA